jgi:hypothetical protein
MVTGYKTTISVVSWGLVLTTTAGGVMASFGCQLPGNRLVVVVVAALKVLISILDLVGPSIS